MDSLSIWSHKKEYRDSLILFGSPSLLAKHELKKSSENEEDYKSFDGMSEVRMSFNVDCSSPVSATSAYSSAGLCDNKIDHIL
jgi:hypothetical protein